MDIEYALISSLSHRIFELYFVAEMMQINAVCLLLMRKTWSLPLYKQTNPYVGDF